MKDYYKLGFIGCGNMGRALALAAVKEIDGKDILLANRTAEKAVMLAGEIGADYGTAKDICKYSEYVFLGVKPQNMKELLSEVADVLKARTTPFILVSMAAGLTSEKIAEMAQGDYPVLRIMPNTPVLKGEGMILCSNNSLVKEEKVEEFFGIMKKAGRLDRIDENLMDAASVISGCAPAFVYMFIDALAKGGADCGLPYEKALEYASQAVIGSGKMMIDGDKVGDPEALRIAVCSPGGSTIEGVKSLLNSDMEKMMKTAVKASFDRTKELGK